LSGNGGVWASVSVLSIEVEYKGDNLESVEKIREFLQSIVTKIGAETAGLDLKGYPFGLLAKKGLLT
jgi:hypothetical protein